MFREWVLFWIRGCFFFPPSLSLSLSLAGFLFLLVYHAFDGVGEEARERSERARGRVVGWLIGMMGAECE